VALARRENRTIVTFDSDFAKILAMARMKEPSVIHIRIQGLTHPRAVATIREVVEAVAKDIEAGCIATVTEAGVRVRRLPLRWHTADAGLFFVVEAQVMAIRGPQRSYDHRLREVVRAGTGLVRRASRLPPGSCPSPDLLR
jgi:hypothetical protein